RGGDVTYHGPGQLVAYPIVDLRAFPSSSPNRNSMGVIEFVRNLEEVLIRTCAEFGIPAKRIAGLAGVWTEPLAVGYGHVGTGAPPRRSTGYVGTGALGAAVERRSTEPREAQNPALRLHASCGVNR